jgi:ribosomal protein S18 acetylase RimI-like enzyme
MTDTTVVSGYTVRCLSAANSYRGLDLEYAGRLAVTAMKVTEHTGGVGWIRSDFAHARAFGEIETWFRKRIQDDLTSVFIAEDVNARVLGAVLLVRNDPFHAAAAKHRAEVNKLMVHPRCRRKGIARALMKALIAKAREEKLEQLVLDVRESPEQAPALELYKSLGFIEFGWQSNYAVDNGTRYEGIHMALDLLAT